MLFFIRKFALPYIFKIPNTNDENLKLYKYPMIRICTDEDLSNLVLLLKELGYSMSEPVLNGHIEAIRSQNGEVFVKEHHGKIVGCINAIIDVRLAEGLCGELVSLVVSESYRGKGIGKELVGYAERWLSERCNVIRVRANSNRQEAHKIYERLGYNEIKSQKIFMKNV